jgi:histone demethylase JARID1
MENGASTPKDVAEHSAVSSGNILDHRQPGLAPAVNGHGQRPLKRAFSHDSLTGSSQTENGDVDGANGRRSKRLKKGMSLTPKRT